MNTAPTWQAFRPARDSHTDAAALTVRSWWQSRHKMARPPALADLPALARAIRGAA